MVSSDDDSFSKVGYSDAEGEDDESFLLTEDTAKLPSTKESATAIKVVVQLPPHFSAGADHAAALFKDAASEASSFIPVTSFGNLKVDHNCDKREGVSVASCPKATRLKESEDNREALLVGGLKGFLARARQDDGSDFSVVSSLHDGAAAATTTSPQTSHKGDDGNSVAAGSTISGFDLISLNGSNNKNQNKNGPTSDYGEDSVAAAGSTISGFDLISLNGSSQKQCQKCSYLNGPEENICLGCTLALVANPNLNVDEKMAQYLQQREEELAFTDVVSQEKKRDSLGQQPILVRALTLASDVLSVVTACRLDVPFRQDIGPHVTGFCALMEANLTVLTSRFIERLDEFAADGFKGVEIAYCFTNKDAWRMTQIRQDGFGPNCQFASTPQLAYTNCPLAIGYGKNKCRYGGGMPTIQESKTAPDLGWIVAIGKGDGADDEKKWIGNEGHTITCKQSVQSLPLVSFDVTIMGNIIIRRLHKSLNTVFTDFFQDQAKNSGNSFMDHSKRRKVDSNGESGPNANVDVECADDEAMALALQASLYETIQDPVDTFACSSPERTLLQFSDERPEQKMALGNAYPDDEIKPTLGGEPDPEAAFNKLMNAALGNLPGDADANCSPVGASLSKTAPVEGLARVPETFHLSGELCPGAASASQIDNAEYNRSGNDIFLTSAFVPATASSETQECPINEHSPPDAVEALADKALAAWMQIATEPDTHDLERVAIKETPESPINEYSPPDAVEALADKALAAWMQVASESDADGMERVGVEVDDARAYSLVAAVASMNDPTAEALNA
jgi:hypothetical protein